MPRCRWCWYLDGSQVEQLVTALSLVLLVHQSGGLQMPPCVRLRLYLLPPLPHSGLLMGLAGHS